MRDDDDDAMLALDRRVREAMPEWRLIVVAVEIAKEIGLLRRAVERLSETRPAPAAKPPTRHDIERERSKPPRKLEA